MIHRKREHKDILRKCQFFLNNKCVHTDEECWFSHGSISQGKTANAGYSCSFCEETFPNMAQLLVHRKEYHNPTKKIQCRDFDKESCRFSSEECWYKHENDISVDENVEECQDSVFQKAKVNQDPPDMMQKIVNMLELLSRKVKSLEETQINQ